MACPSEFRLTDRVFPPQLSQFLATLVNCRSSSSPMVQLHFPGGCSMHLLILHRVPEKQRRLQRGLRNLQHLSMPANHRHQGSQTPKRKAVGSVVHDLGVLRSPPPTLSVRVALLTHRVVRAHRDPEVAAHFGRAPARRNGMALRRRMRRQASLLPLLRRGRSSPEVVAVDVYTAVCPALSRPQPRICVTVPSSHEALHRELGTVAGHPLREKASEARW